MTRTIHRGYLPGIVGDVTAMHGRYYAREWKLQPQFEFGVARGLCEYFEHYDEGSDLALSVQEDDRTRGFVAISRNRVELYEANLRWFIVDDALRGNGIGRSLLDAALEHCRETGVRRLELFTFDSLEAARALYRSAGFTTFESMPHDGWGPTINLERHELRFSPPEVMEE
jgi:GNAT superfamily N-acetyltransferase